METRRHQTALHEEIMESGTAFFELPAEVGQISVMTDFS